MVRPWDGMFDTEILQRDHKEADHYKNDPSDPSLRKSFPDKEDRPDLREERGRAGDRVDQGEIASPVGLNKTDEIDGLEKTGGDGETPEFGRGMGEKRRKNTKSDEERKIKDDTQEEDPKKEFSGPVSSLRKEIP